MTRISKGKNIRKWYGRKYKRYKVQKEKMEKKKKKAVTTFFFLLSSDLVPLLSTQLSFFLLTISFPSVSKMKERGRKIIGITNIQLKKTNFFPYSY